MARNDLVMCGESVYMSLSWRDSGWEGSSRDRKEGRVRGRGYEGGRDTRARQGRDEVGDSNETNFIGWMGEEEPSTVLSLP